jgi:hypothetical protein
MELGLITLLQPKAAANIEKEALSSSDLNNRQHWLTASAYECQLSGIKPVAQAGVLTIGHKTAV